MEDVIVWNVVFRFTLLCYILKISATKLQNREVEI